MARKDPKYIADFKAMTRASVTHIDLPALEAEMYASTDRSAAVMLTAIVESSLDKFIRSNLRPTLNADDSRLLFDYVGPLGGFGSRTLVAYAFNLFGPETRNDLDLIRLVRNGFAHSKKSFDFSAPEAAAVCAELKSPEWEGATPSVGHLLALLKMSPAEIEQAADKSHPRSRWMIACHVLNDRLLRNAGHFRGDTSVPDLR